MPAPVTRPTRRSPQPVALGRREPRWPLPSLERVGPDPGLGLPPPGNRPASRAGAHGLARHLPGQAAQVRCFLAPEDPAIILQFCGEAPCSLANPGG